MTSERIKEELSTIEQQAQRELEHVQTLEDLAAWKSTYLGKGGKLSSFGQLLGSLPPDDRPSVGSQINTIRTNLEQLFESAEAAIKRKVLEATFEADRVDITLPGRRPSVGHMHLVNQVLRKVTMIFAEMGFQVWESREVELDEYNFGLLNFPPDHPARDMQDTFYLDMPPGAPKVLLRTHTSPGQIHAMHRYAPEPLRVLLPGKCYRNEQITARSEIQFHQFEFLAIGPSITMSDLKGTLDHFAIRMFGEGTKVRLRASYFPFTEPSAEMDVSCFLCQGNGCRVCKYSGWLEIGGCGMVHPNVLRNGGYDPERFSGFAGGFGPERISMTKYGIDDIRWFNSGDMRFIEQF